MIVIYCDGSSNKFDYLIPNLYFILYYNNKMKGENRFDNLVAVRKSSNKGSKDLTHIDTRFRNSPKQSAKILETNVKHGQIL